MEVNGQINFRPLNPLVANSGYEWIRSYMDQRKTLGVLEKQNCLVLAGNQTPDHPARNQVTILTEISVHFRALISCHWYQFGSCQIFRKLYIVNILKYYSVLVWFMCRCSSVGTVTVLGAGLSEVRIPPVERSFLFPEMSIWALGFIQLPVQWTPMPFIGGKAVKFNSHLYNADVKNGWSYEFNPLCDFVAYVLY
jgi:hypothetical protein